MANKRVTIKHKKVAALAAVVPMIFLETIVKDNRFAAEKKTNICTIPSGTWKRAEECEHELWYFLNLRMRRPTFNAIVDFLETNCRPMYYSEKRKCVVDFRTAVAITIAYLATEGSWRVVSTIFGISKSHCQENANRVMDAMLSIID